MRALTLTGRRGLGDADVAAFRANARGARAAVQAGDQARAEELLAQASALYNELGDVGYLDELEVATAAVKGTTLDVVDPTTGVVQKLDARTFTAAADRQLANTKQNKAAADAADAAAGGFWGAFGDELSSRFRSLAGALDVLGSWKGAALGIGVGSLALYAWAKGRGGRR